MNEYYFKKANENLPPLFYETVSTETAVRIVADPTTFFGCRAETAGSMPQTIQAGDVFVADLGRHCVGRLSFEIGEAKRRADAPIRLRLRFAETPYELYRSNDSYHGRLCSSWLMEETLLIDTIGQVKLPRRYSFRYVEFRVEAAPCAFTLDNITAVCETSADPAAFSPLPPATDPLLSEIDRVAAETLRECMHTVYEDGPKRDRRLWAGDLYMQVLTDQVLYQNDMLTRRCLYLFAACHQKGQILPHCLYDRPKLSFREGGYFLDYALLFCVCAADYFARSGDLTTLQDLFPVLYDQVELTLGATDPQGLLDPEGRYRKFIDWAPNLQKNTAAHGCWLFSLERLIPLARALNENATAEKWQAALNKGRCAAKAQLYNEERGIFVNDYDKGQRSVQAQVWMILGGVISGEDGKCALLTALNDAAAVQPVTPYMHHYLVEAMLKIGMKGQALQHIKSYWGAMLSHGADTFWEVFVPGDADISPYHDPLIHSFCHAWSCSPSYFIRKYFTH